VTENFGKAWGTEREKSVHLKLIQRLRRYYVIHDLSEYDTLTAAERQLEQDRAVQIEDPAVRANAPGDELVEDSIGSNTSLERHEDLVQKMIKIRKETLLKYQMDLLDRALRDTFRVALIDEIDHEGQVALRGSHASSGEGLRVSAAKRSGYAGSVEAGEATSEGIRV